MHRNTAIVVALVAALSLAALATGFDASRFQTVGGDFGRSWISQYEKPSQSQEPAAQTGAQESQGGATEVETKDLWSWGSAPKGYKVQNGQLVAEPIYYVNGTYYDLAGYNNLLNRVRADNWLEYLTYDPYTGYTYPWTYSDYASPGYTYPGYTSPGYASPVGGVVSNPYSNPLPPALSTSNPWA